MEMINLVSLGIIIIKISHTIERTVASVELAEAEVLVVIVLTKAVEEEDQEATTKTTTEVPTLRRIKDTAVEEAGLLKSHIMKKKM